LPIDPEQQFFFAVDDQADVQPVPVFPVTRMDFS
jgi:hypothetical protein